MPTRKKIVAAALGAAAAGAAVLGISISSASPGTSAVSAASASTTTPIKHVVVLFDENISFDHYFGTYPHATNPPGQPKFTSLPGTPSVNGLNDSLLTANPNTNLPARLGPNQAVTCDQNHGYSAEQSAFDMGLMDKFVQDTTGGGCSQSSFPDQGDYGPAGIVMDYYDGNTVTGLWNLAQHFTLNDNSYDTQFGPSSPGAINLISGNTFGAMAHGGTSSNIANGTLIGDAEPLYDQCSNSGTPLNPDGTPGGVTAQMTGTNVGDVLNRKNLTWGWFQGGFTPSAVVKGRAICGTTHNNIANSPSADYSEHHEPFQYYADTANPNHVSPSLVSQVGHSDPAGTPPTKAINHQYDLSWFNKSLTAGDLPSVSFLKPPEYEDGHAGYSDPLDEQRFIVDEINAIERSSAWPSTAIVIAYDDSDGWYDHQIGPIIRPSQDTADSLSGAGKCGNVPNPPPSGFQNDRCGVGPRTPLLVISPWARENFVDNTFTEQASITRFIEDNWGLGRIGNHSADASAGSLDSAFNFSQSYGHAPAIIMNDTNGEITQTIPATPPPTTSAPSKTTPVSSSPPTTATAPDVPASSPSAAKAAAGSTATAVKLPRVTCSHRTAKTAIRLTCTTRGGSRVPTLMRARLLRGRRLVANRAAMVRRNRARFSLPLARARSGRYTIRLTVDAGGRVGSLTRYVRVG